MNKTLVITLATASLSAPILVNADTTLYGSLHTSIDIVDDGSDSKNVSLSNNQSYFGIKGSEKINDDLSAVYKIEFGPDMGGKGNELKNRDQYVGLSSNKLGSVLAGRMSSPYKIVQAQADLFWYSQLGSNRSLATDGFRNNNTIAYFSPKMGGFTAAISHVTEGLGSNPRKGIGLNFLDEKNQESYQNDANTLWSGNVFYKAGGFKIGVGYEKNNSITDVTNLMTSYQIGKFKIVGFAEKMDFSNRRFEKQVAEDTGSLDEEVKSSTTEIGNNTYGIGASMKIKNGTIKAQYYTQEHKVVLPSGFTFISDGKPNRNSTSELFSIGYDYNLSKRTTIYAQYALSKNDNAFDNNYQAQLGTNGVGGKEGGRNSYSTIEIKDKDGEGTGKFPKTLSGVSFGIKHNF